MHWRFPNALMAVAFHVAALFAVPASAATFCVHDNAELGSALYTAQGNGITNSVRLVQGTITLSQAIDFRTDADFALSGGWNSTCTLRTPNASNTVIEGAGTLFVSFRAHALTVDAVHFHGTPVNEFRSESSVLRRNRFSGPNTSFTGAVQVASSIGSVLLDSNLFDGKNVSIRSYDGTYDAPALDWRAINNTFVGAVEGASGSVLVNGYGLSLTVPGVGDNVNIVLANNIAWGNSDGGVFFNGAVNALLVNNQWQSLTNNDNVPPAAGSGNNSTANPQLDGNRVPIAPGSPAINSGTTVVPGGVGAYDVTGGPRIIGSKPDRGAFETAANDQSVITVTTAADTGDCSGPGDTTCSLRGALAAAAAASNAQRIVFAIPGTSCPRIISVDSALPSVIDDLTIDGYSQPGAQANTLDVGSDARLCVLLHDNYAGGRGLFVDGAGSRLDVRGLAFENFNYAAIDVIDGAHHVIQGNQFGGPLAIGDGATPPLALMANRVGVALHGNSSDVLLGGPDAAQRNVIDDSTATGVEITGDLASVHVVRNNYIGLTPDGRSTAGNLTGVLVRSYFNIVQDNYIAASAYDGLRIDGSDGQGNAVLGNVIGLPAAGINAVSNGGSGVRLSNGASNNLIGLNLQGFASSNTIVGNGINGVGGPANGDGGVAVDSGTGNRITGNIIYANYGLNIDLGHDGATANDANDGDSGANMLQNFPQLLSISHVGDQRILSGSIHSTNGLLLEVFGSTYCGNSGRGNAAVKLGSRALVAPPSGEITFKAYLGRGPGTGVDNFCRLSATVTSVNTNDLSQHNNTSELSACFVDDTIFAHGFDSATGWSCAP
ncbi:MAG: hypothetical protein DWB45_06385 [Xanthomonadales bacterium]|nr:hypothetical protein [Xanthomonadales bacterium]